MSTPILEQPEVLRMLFHPRRDYGFPYSTSSVRVVMVEVEQGVSAGGRLYPAGPQDSAILFFHGNGEIAADYDDIAPMYKQLGITLLVMDYRGYGISTGAPTASNLLADAVIVFDEVGSIFQENGLAPSQLYVMGRSLGSAAAIEVALFGGEHLSGMIIESGFADTFALLARLGIRVPGADEERDGFGNLSKIGRINTRTLVIHGEDDVLIPPADGRELYHNCASRDKQLVLIPGAGHNDLMMVGMKRYFEAIKKFVDGEAVV